MNLYAWIILTALILEYAVNLVADRLNLRALRTDLPAEMAGVYPEESYRRSQEYTRATTRFEGIVSTLSLALILAFWFSGGFNLLDRMVRSWDMGSIPTGLIYIGILLVFRTAFSLPFRVYATFVIEARFGFNRTTPGTFIADSIKGIALAAALGGPLLAILLAFFEYAGPYGWLYAWAVLIGYLLFVQFIAPTWIMPLFNTFTPLEEGELKERILAYARSVRFPLKNVFVIDGSRRSSKSNAFFTGFGRNKRVALYDTLIAGHTVAELVAVLAHEIGHYKKRHILQGLLISILHMGVLFFLLSVFLGHRGLFDAFYMEQPSVYSGLLFFGMLLTPMEMVLSLFVHLLSRRNEYQADRFAVTTLHDPDAMIEALKKLAAHNLANLTPHPFFTFLNASHPPLMSRIRAIRPADSR